MENPTRLALTKGGNILENHADKGLSPIPRGPHRHGYCSRSKGSRQRSHSRSKESRRQRHRSHSYGHASQGSDSLGDERPYNAAMDAMSQALRRATRSPFLKEIERAPMPCRFTQPPFNSYDVKADPVEHVSHYIHLMSLHTHNDALMCKVFPSSLGSTALRWFNGLRKGSIRSFTELIQEFGAWFVMCSRVSQPADALLFIKMGAGETLRSYASLYWELYNEIGDGNQRITTSTLRMGLIENS